MSSELTCPDCGGIIGGDSTDPGQACTCYSTTAKATDVARDRPAGVHTAIDPAGAAQAKICCQCGKDLAGQKRLRDSRGYWCYACHKLDQEATKPQGKRCADCGRKVAESALSDVDGKLICGKCQLDRKQEEKGRRRLSPVKTDAYDQMNKKKLVIMFAVVAVLATIIILRQLKIIGS